MVGHQHLLRDPLGLRRIEHDALHQAEHRVRDVVVELREGGLITPGDRSPTSSGEGSIPPGKTYSWIQVQEQWVASNPTSASAPNRWKKSRGRSIRINTRSKEWAQ
ncbi:hypothetical protein [Saccharopolyspora oryzae]|uniref:hypothetical protein n=1 Tax=Saccharopolyspora oryzae TaxID=2997343 RepID=UPI0038CD5566